MLDPSIRTAPLLGFARYMAVHLRNSPSARCLSSLSDFGDFALHHDATSMKPKGELPSLTPMRSSARRLLSCELFTHFSHL